MAMSSVGRQRVVQRRLLLRFKYSDEMRLVMTEAPGDTKVSGQLTRPGDLKTPDEYQRRLDQTKSGDLKGQEQDDSIHREKPVMTGDFCLNQTKNLSKPDEMNVNSEDRNEREEQPDFYRPSCVKGDGEV
ncbi:hypothetical protein Bbelb_068750 [Branchiostoma belcheri]|nr:hypothetical protein Bbelb_068750 [Branchiostoma belcheri]